MGRLKRQSKGRESQATVVSRTSYKQLLTLSFIIVAFVFTASFRAFQGYLLDSSGVITKGVVIDKKNYFRSAFYYSYSFEADGKKYTENSHDPTCKVGDTVRIKYVPDFPSFNRRVIPQ